MCLPLLIICRSGTPIYANIFMFTSTNLTSFYLAAFMRSTFTVLRAFRKGHKLTTSAKAHSTGARSGDASPFNTFCQAGIAMRWACLYIAHKLVCLGYAESLSYKYLVTPAFVNAAALNCQNCQTSLRSCSHRSGGPT